MILFLYLAPRKLLISLLCIKCKQCRNVNQGRLLLGHLHDVDELGQQRRTANQETINVGTRNERLCVACLDGAAVDDAHTASNGRGHIGCDPGTDLGMSLFSLLRGGNFACADCPDRLVCDDNILPVRLANGSSDGEELLGTDAHSITTLTLS